MVERVFWKGIYFAPTNSSERQGNSSLEYADIINAFEGIKALKKAPDLFNVTVRDGASGLLVKELENDLAIINSNILRSRLAGINIESSRGGVMIENVTVKNTRFGDGLVYKRAKKAVDFCSVIPREASFPIVLNATGKALPVNCSQVRVIAVDKMGVVRLNTNQMFISWKSTLWIRTRDTSFASRLVLEDPSTRENDLVTASTCTCNDGVHSQ